MKVVIEDASNISVSNSATLDQLVNLYYDHLMPKSSRKELIITQMVDENESMNNTEVVNNNLSPEGEINCMIKKRKHSVDNNTDELITVSSAKQSNCSETTTNNNSNDDLLPVDNLTSKETNVNIPVDNDTNNVHQSVCKKDTVQLDSLMKEIMRSVPQPTDKKSSDAANTDSKSNSTVKKRQKINREFKTLVK
ncbi:unnamed protein product [Trichobilharzia szidati]|nr:unnamed protein product [Trichobilharzia szidati]